MGGGNGIATTVRSGFARLLPHLRRGFAAARPHLSLFPDSFTPALGYRAFSWRYAIFAWALVLAVALYFYSQLRLQLFYVDAQRGAIHPSSIWSAPLDDVFIHFDFARSAARGYPFHWIVDNGYSSGGTSLSYPLFLALGYLAGAKGTLLMVWAGTLACLWVLGTLLIGRILFLRAALPAWTAWLLPPMLLSVGVLSWSLWSGMEVAVLLFAWALTLLAWLNFAENPSAPQHTLLSRAALLGLTNALLVATRPESLCWVLIFAVFAIPALRFKGLLRSLTALCAILGPPAVILISHQVANKIFTGDWSAAGALVKLEFYHPYWTRQQAIDSWNFFVEYQFDRITEHHLAVPFAWRDWRIEIPGELLYWLAAVPLLSVTTRRYAALLWCCALSWVLMVALNGQVRWQNDRYTVPALALLLISASLGLGLIARFVTHARVPWLLRIPVGVATAAVLFILGQGQLPLYRDQVWFFARASRNIYEQHMTTALALRAQNPKPKRVLLGDAGAIPYLSDLPALDIIGLGGYHDLPFARASRLGMGAIVELIERMPSAQRPDLFAIYPTWWGDLPSWFGQKRLEVPVRGNVICGGAAKVVYTANWQPLDGSEQPFTSLSDVAIQDTIDFADVVSERAHRQRIVGAPGYVVMKLLDNPKQPNAELWDAGRAIPSKAALQVNLDGLQPNKPLTLVLRLTATPRSQLQISAGGAAIPAPQPRALDGWEELQFTIAAEHVAKSLLLQLKTEQGEVSIYHLWAAQ
ncbi:MAG TPA: hypothetical protein VHO25_02535 [Polyangiaceae bacterium]|nr:hypothetical protein [Polyangiaceae bacterium]